MICCLCKKREAKVHLSQYIGDEPTEANLVAKVDLCNECAAQHQHEVNDLPTFDIIALAKKARGQ